MKHLVNFPSDYDWIEGGCLLIIGKPSPKDGLKRLYIVSIVKVSNYDRQLVDGEKGIPTKMATISNDFRILKYKEGKIVDRKIDYNPKIMKDYLGLSGFSVSLNKNKTPMWPESIKLGINDFLKKHNDELLNIPIDIVYPIEK